MHGRQLVIPVVVVGFVVVMALAWTVLPGAIARAINANDCPSGAGCQRVLFVGNSYTSANDLPAMAGRLARSAGHPIVTGMVAEGGATLAAHATNATTLAEVAGGRWSIVVLQEQSQVPALPASRGQMATAAAAIVAAIRGAGAEAVLFETWAHAGGWPEAGLDEASMAAALFAGYEGLGSRLGVPVAMVGRAFQRAAAAAPGVALRQDDGSHPTPAGTYLAACVLVAAITGADPTSITDDGGLPGDSATMLRAAAR